MAGNKINTKKKDDKNKTNRISSQTMEETEDFDFSLLRKPILTSITGFAQARKIFDSATEELKSLLTTECDILYECKVCRNIFRSLANYISHKRIYCKDRFNSSIHGHFIKPNSTINEMLTINRLEQGYQASLRDKNEKDTMDLDESDDRIPITKDLTAIIEKIAKNKGVQMRQLEDQQLVFQKIPKSSVAVFQNIQCNEMETDSMKSEVQELDNILSQENAILQSDGTFKVKSNSNISLNQENVIQISDDEDNDNEESDILKCKICDLQFSTQKTLKFHMKYKHLESRLVYPCPDCLDIFSTSWSVYRHLFKVHRKTAAQIRRLRESIQAKAFRMNNPPAFYEKRKTSKTVAPQKITEEERIIQENQAWLEELEGEAEGRRCGGCGRTFERRAALASHAHTCARRTQRRRIEIQIRKDYHKEPPPYPALARATSDPSADSKDSKSDVEDKNKTDDKVEEEKEDKNEEGNKTLTEAVMSVIGDKSESQDEVISHSINEISVQSKLQLYENLLINRLPFAQQAEKSNLNAFKQKIIPEIDLDELVCKKCVSKHEKMNILLEHMAGHYKWMRYACKLCNFKHFNFEKLPEHVKIVHKLKGDSDFYYSTVKAIDGTEALELSETNDELNDASETSPDSRRPSRCSSDSSRLSDDSSSSSTRQELLGSRKRKANHIKNMAKRKKEVGVTDDGDDSRDENIRAKDVLSENESLSNTKIFEENSSDMDDVEEKVSKRGNEIVASSVASRRPVRKKTKPKNEDFEYDLSNLLKMEAQGYRDAQNVSNKSIATKKKVQHDLQSNYDIINKECGGALITLSRKAVENSRALMKTNLVLFNTAKEARITNVFARPMLPKISRIDKISPKKIESEELTDVASPKKVTDTINVANKDLPIDKSVKKEPEISPINNAIDVDKKCTTDSKAEPKPEIQNEELKKENINAGETSKPNLKKPNILPIKFRRQSLEVIKNPLIKKNITDFTKAGMKTKILVIKPLNRGTEASQNLNNPLKFQTITLKDPSKISNDDKKSDQVVVVQVPKVECNINRQAILNKKSIASVDIKSDNSNSEKIKLESLPVGDSDKTKTLNGIESTSEDSEYTVKPELSEPNQIDKEPSSDLNEVTNPEIC